jgi:hypothetical protein
LRDDGLSSTRNQHIPRSGRGYHNSQKSSPGNPAKACLGFFRVDVRMVGQSEADLLLPPEVALSALCCAADILPEYDASPNPALSQWVDVRR